MLKNSVIILFIIICGCLFFNINENNYAINSAIKEVKVNHPELLPSYETAKLLSFGFSNVLADKYWLETIQYIGGNAVSSEYKKYLYEMVDLISSLNPYFSKPYTTTLLLLPDVNKRYENGSDEENKRNIDNTIKIGQKGIKNFCDEKKIELIDKEIDLNKLQSDEYKNPCLDSTIPYFLAYDYHFYANDSINSAKYYKVAAADENALEGAKIMAAIMEGKGGSREKSIIMFLNLAQNIDEDNVCKDYALELEDIIISTQLTGNLMKIIGDTTKKISEGFTTEDIINSTSCVNFVNKAVRELNLFYIEQNNNIFYKKSGFNALTPQELKENGYLDYIPIDFQQYESYGIKYFFNEDTGNFDYKMEY